MSLHIYDKGLNERLPLRVEKDAEKLFALTPILGSGTDRILIETIEQGRYLDKYSFEDRFGHKLYLSELSTGTKAALSVTNNDDVILDTRGIGENALEAIICLCKSGNILMDVQKLSIDDTIRSKIKNGIDVVINGFRIYDIDCLIDYINDKYWYPKEMIRTQKGVIELVEE